MAVSMAMLALPVYPTGMDLCYYRDSWARIHRYRGLYARILYYWCLHFFFFLMLASNDSLIMLLGGDPFVTVGAGERSKCLGCFVLP